MVDWLVVDWVVDWVVLDGAAAVVSELLVVGAVVVAPSGLVAAEDGAWGAVLLAAALLSEGLGVAGVVLPGPVVL